MTAYPPQQSAPTRIRVRPEELDEGEFMSAFSTLESEFEKKFGRKFRITGEDTPIHQRLHGAGRARDIGGSDLNDEEGRFIVDRGNALGLDIGDYRTNWRKIGGTGPHIHVDYSDRLRLQNQQPPAKLAPGLIRLRPEDVEDAPDDTASTQQPAQAGAQTQQPTEGRAIGSTSLALPPESPGVKADWGDPPSTLGTIANVALIATGGKPLFEGRAAPPTPANLGAMRDELRTNQHVRDREARDSSGKLQPVVSAAAPISNNRWLQQGNEPLIRRDAKGNPLTHDGYPAIKNRDGSYTTERSITVTDPRLNGGAPTNIPSVWKGKQYSDKEAIRLAYASRRRFPSFGSTDEAVAAAQARSDEKGKALDQSQPAPGRIRVRPDEVQDVPAAAPASRRPSSQKRAAANAPDPRATALQSRLDQLNTEINSLAENRNRLTAAGFNQDASALAPIDNAINQRARERAQLQDELGKVQSGKTVPLSDLKSQLGAIEASREQNLRSAAASQDEREQQRLQSIANQENDRAQMLKRYIDIEEKGGVAHPALRESALRPVTPERIPTTWEKISGGVGAGAAGVFGGLDQLGANLFNSDALRKRAQEYHELGAISAEQAGPGLTPALATAVTQAGLTYPMLRAISLLGQALGPGLGVGEMGGEAGALGLYGATEHAHEGLGEATKAGVMTALPIPFIHGAAAKSLPTRASVGFAAGFIPTLLESGDFQQALAQGLVFGGMGAAGKKRAGETTAEARPAAESFPVKDIIADPERFQFKQRGGSQTGASGTFGKDTKFSPEMVKDDPFLVWRDPADGNAYIVDGHNRLNLAKRDGVEAVPVEFIKAQDANEARAVGAMKNILRRNGSDKDAGEFLGESKLTGEDLVRLATDNNLQPLVEGAARGRIRVKPDEVQPIVETSPKVNLLGKEVAGRGGPVPEGAPSSRVNLLDAQQGKQAPAGVRRLLEERRQIEERAALDEHTGLQNKNQWINARKRIDADPSREVVALDVNDLKKFNDRVGHDAGDDYMAHVGKVVIEEAQKLGISPRQAYRTGGDEIFVDAPKGKGKELLAAVKTRVAEFEREGIKGSISGGVGPTAKKADVLLYADKSQMKAAAAKSEVRQRANEKIEAARARARVSVVEDEGAVGMTPGASGRDVLSNEELARTERFFKVGRGEAVTSLGKQPDAPLRPGEAIIAIDPNGRARVVNSSGVVDEPAAISKARRTLTEQGTLSINERVMEKASPDLVQKVEDTPLREIADKSGLNAREANKGVNDVLADGAREFSPEAVAVKRGLLRDESGSRTESEAVNISAESRAAFAEHKLPANEITRAAESKPAANEPEFVRAARERLRQSIAGNKLNANPLGALKDAAIITGYDVFKTTMSKAEWSREMTLRLGRKVKAVLDDVWDHITTGKFSAADVKRRLDQTRLIPTGLVEEILSGNRPEHVNNIVDFLATQRKKIVEGAMTASDVARAYVMTVSSQGADAMRVDVLKPKLEAAGVHLDITGDYITRNKQGQALIRPEDAMGLWLQSPNGQRALEAMERGVFDSKAWNEASKVRSAFGDDRLRNRNVFGDQGGGAFNLRNIDKLLPMLNKAKGDPKMIGGLVAKLNGVGTGKTPFMKMLLGFGDAPTIDAVEINTWLTGRGSTRGQTGRNVELARAIKDMTSKTALMEAVSERINSRFNDLRRGGVVGSDLAKEDFGAVVHHWLWDKMKGTENPQRGLYDAMKAEPEFIAKSRARLRESLSGNRTNSNPVQDLYDAAVVTGYDIYTSVKDFGGWSKRMLEEFGDNVKPHLEKIWKEFEGATPRPAQTETTASDVPPVPSSRPRQKPLEVASSLLKAGMVSGLQTSARNIISTVSHLMAEGGPTRAIAAMTDMIVSAGTGNRTVTKPSVIETSRSAYEAATRGMREAGEIIKRGVPDHELDRLANSKEIATGSVVWDRILNFPFRFLAAQDRVLKVFATEQALADRARAEALTEKRAGRIGAESVDGLTKDIIRDAKAGMREDLIMNAYADAEVATFNNASKLGEEWSAFKNRRGQVGKFIADQAIPFLNVPLNVIRRQLDGMGLGFGVAATKAVVNKLHGAAFPTPEAQRNFAMMAGRLGTGAATALLGAALKQAGVLTGYGDEKGKPKASIKIGGRWYRVDMIPPFGALLALGATFHGEMTRELSKGESRAGNVIGATAESLVPQTPFARPVRDFVEPAIESIQKKSFKPVMNQTAESVAGRFVPAIVNEVARASDDKERTVRGPLEAAMARVPALRQKLQPKRDGLGREVERSGAPGFAGGMVDIFRSVKDEAATDPVMRELQDNNVNLRPMLQGGDEPDDKFNKRADQTGKLLRDRLNTFINLNEYKTLPADLRQEVLKAAIKDARADAKTVRKGGRLPSAQNAKVDLQVTISSASAIAGLRKRRDYQSLSILERESADDSLRSRFAQIKVKAKKDVDFARDALLDLKGDMSTLYETIIENVRNKRDDR